MNTTEFGEALHVLGWSARHLALVLDCHRNLPLAWLSGRAVVPVEVAHWLEVLVKVHQQHPAPKNWRRLDNAVGTYKGFDAEQASLRTAAHAAVAKALRDGVLAKRPCEICGAKRVEAHHTDYSQPLSAVWLCPPHHRERHRQDGTGRWQRSEAARLCDA